MDLIIIYAIIIGLIAELVDSSLGMAYGVTANTLLLTVGLAPVISSATVHTSEVFITLASGLSHLRLGNVDKNIFKKLIITGIIGGVIGAYALSNITLSFIRPAVNLYLICMGAVIILRAYNKNIIFRKINKPILAFIGGFMDAVGGGGWGPIVTSTLIAGGDDPPKVIGSVNLAEFFITTAESITFILFIGLQNLVIVAGILIGGLITAPIGALICRSIPRKQLMLAVGLLVIISSVIRFVM